MQVHKEKNPECEHGTQEKKKWLRKSSRMWRVQIPTFKLPFKAPPREESHSNCHFYRKSGCTYVYEAIPVVVCISALYKPMHNIIKMLYIENVS